MEDKKALRNQKVGRRVYLIVDHMPFPFVETKAGNMLSRSAGSGGTPIVSAAVQFA